MRCLDADWPILIQATVVFETGLPGNAGGPRYAPCAKDVRLLGYEGPRRGQPSWRAHILSVHGVYVYMQKLAIFTGFIADRT